MVDDVRGIDSLEHELRGVHEIGMVFFRVL